MTWQKTGCWTCKHLLLSITCSHPDSIISLSLSFFFFFLNWKDNKWGSCLDVWWWSPSEWCASGGEAQRVVPLLLLLLVVLVVLCRCQPPLCCGGERAARTPSRGHTRLDKKRDHWQRRHNLTTVPQVCYITREAWLNRWLPSPSYGAISCWRHGV